MRKALIIITVAGAVSLAPLGVAGATAKGHHKAKPKAAKTVKAQPWIGSTLTVLNQDKETLAVQLQTLTDPAQGADEFTTPDAGKRFVGVTIEITNKSKSGTASDDANSDLTVVGTDKQVYQADFNSLAGCTNFASGMYTVAPGTSEVGCVAYQLPTGVNVAKVSFNPNGGFSTNNANWTAP